MEEKHPLGKIKNKTLLPTRRVLGEKKTYWERGRNDHGANSIKSRRGGPAEGKSVKGYVPRKGRSLNGEKTPGGRTHQSGKRP